MTQGNRPPTQRPPHTNTNVTNNSINTRAEWGTIGKVLLAIVICLGAVSLIAPYVIEAVELTGNTGPEPIHIENRFIDIDSDGDEDFIQQADVLLNCGGELCVITATPAPLATQAASQPAPPTPMVTPDG